jgi:serine/threonine-protein kinase
VAAVAAESSVPDHSVSDAPTRLDTGASTLPEAGALPMLSEGSRLGPYLVRGLAGAGGMGVVYAAEDPRLGRKVALKLLRPRGDGAGAEARERLLREAQAMARLSHPNVLPIFELGTADGRDFLAMEWVEGTTLDGWLRERERPWREVLALLLAAGAGLAAAHRAGLVHRDFKPANVLVGGDGRARVTDFGLASQGPVEDAAAPTEAASGARLTRAGAVPGTPAYMSPEQRAGRAVDARSDQYSFCVTLHEALHGARPGAGPVPSRRRALPGQVRAALARGLAAEPLDRFPSMDALLAALSAPSRSRTLPLALTLLGAGLGVLLWRGGPVPTAPEEDPQEAELQEALETAKSGAGNVLLQLRVGEQRELSVPGLTRVAVGDPSILDIQASSNVLKMTALASGATHVLVWAREGELRVYTVSVTLR